ncbi:MAG: disulfide bond formation protein B [Alphaproteobacteria bacterium]
MLSKNALLRHSRLLVGMALVSGFVLAGALFGQFVLGWHPCDLCLLQRYPYMAIIILAAIGLLVRGKPKAQATLVMLGIVCFLVTAGIGAYHTGVEMKWVKGPSACSATDTSDMTLEEMREALKNAPLVSCDQAMAYVLGLSLAAWNFIIALGMAIFSAYMFFYIRKRKLS